MAAAPAFSLLLPLGSKLSLAPGLPLLAPLVCDQDTTWIYGHDGASRLPGGTHSDRGTRATTLRIPLTSPIDKHQAYEFLWYNP